MFRRSAIALNDSECHKHHKQYRTHHHYHHSRMGRCGGPLKFVVAGLVVFTAVKHFNEGCPFSKEGRGWECQHRRHAAVTESATTSLPQQGVPAFWDGKQWRALPEGGEGGAPVATSRWECPFKKSTHEEREPKVRDC
eukprot:TRINITY_DN118_c0_g1_i2.p1 TRINITY_DN118_c0_g1~~TRINITY_DN118_c0_g1_i2.p1  ORF type:complete len:138 (+),score=20.09 TRINITY_DN118_c0_g1_i2:61-474(+)